MGFRNIAASQLHKEAQAEIDEISLSLRAAGIPTSAFSFEISDPFKDASIYDPVAMKIRLFLVWHEKL